MTHDTKPGKANANDMICRIVQCVNSGKHDDIYQLIDEYAATVRSPSLRHRLTRLQAEKPVRLRSLDDLPLDIKKLVLQHQYPDDPVFISPAIAPVINQLLLEWEHSDIYRHHQLPVRNKILLHGPTGNGKTTIARHIAALAQLPFIEVNADTVVDSKLGHSGMNIHNIFHHLKQPCILFWDEVDTIGRRRSSDSSAAGFENERMVNSMLVNIEKMGADTIFIGATNRKEVLDNAFLRRFDVQIELPSPTMPDKQSYVVQLLQHYKMPEVTISNIDIAEAVSYCDIKLLLLDVARNVVLRKITKKPVAHA